MMVYLNNIMSITGTLLDMSCFLKINRNLWSDQKQLHYNIQPINQSKKGEIFQITSNFSNLMSDITELFKVPTIDNCGNLCNNFSLMFIYLLILFKFSIYTILLNFFNLLWKQIIEIFKNALILLLLRWLCKYDFCDM